MAKQVFVPFPNNRPQGYSPVTKAGNIVYVSGQVATDENGNLVGSGDFRAQAEQCFRNVEAALNSAGATMDDLVKITAFLVNASDYEAYASLRNQRFPQNGPTSSTVVVKALVRPELLFEIEAVAVTSGTA